MNEVGFNADQREWLVEAIRVEAPDNPILLIQRQRCRIMFTRRMSMLAGLAALCSAAAVHAADPPAGPAYQIVLRSRNAEVTPSRVKDAETGGGWIQVEQPEPNTIVISMNGAAVAGSALHGSAASIDFKLEQDLEIIPLRAGVRPPRLAMVGRLIGTLQVTDPGKCGKSCGTGEQGPATACLLAGGTSVLSVSMKPSSVSCGQESFINNRQGPVEALAGVGAYSLTGSFHLSVNQGLGVWNRQAAVADFDPAPRLDGSWGDVLKPFRAVPRKDFGFKIIVRVVEDAPPESAPKN